MLSIGNLIKTISQKYHFEWYKKGQIPMKFNQKNKQFAIINKQFMSTATIVVQFFIIFHSA